jgi:hypothetical protein
MARPEGELPPGLEYSDRDLSRWHREPVFHAKVYATAQLLSLVYGTEKNEAIAFGLQVVKCLEGLDQPGEAISGY